MLRYYSYYNVGGYKDMFLGDSTLLAKSTYFLPLLPVWRKRANGGDAALAERVEMLEKLPQINVITSDSEFGLPKYAYRLISHAGYKIFLSTVESGETIFAIRDIDSNSRDESGRAIPFMLLIVGTEESDRVALERLTSYAVSRLNEVSKRLADLFVYNVEVNGVEFSLEGMNALVEDMASKGSGTFETLSKEVVINSSKYDVPILVIPEGLNKSIAERELNLKGQRVNYVELSKILPLDDLAKRMAMLENRGGNDDDSSGLSILSKKGMLSIVAVVAIVAIIILCVILFKD